MLRVPVYARFKNPKPKEIGFIIWDGHKLRADPPDDPIISSILDNTLLTKDGVVSPKKDPEKWLHSLHISGNSSYLWFGEAVDE